MERREIVIEGMVQGVGFRPFVHGLAGHLGLSGFVRNQAGGVRIEVEGDQAPLDQFLHRLVREAPPLAHIEDVTWGRRPARGEMGFRIEASARGGAGAVVIVPDTATCAACLAEMRDPGDRRYRYPFTNCTHCGPRLTIITGAPYDRPRTTMAGFAMCAPCRAEYEDPANRRFHAQPIACPACGPRLGLLDAQGASVDGDDPLAAAAAALLAGKIVAIKGLGGYHLSCLAGDAQAVAALRRRKHREEKPFAVMARDLEEVRRWCAVSAAEEAVLTSPRRPVVLLQRLRPGAAGGKNLGLGIWDLGFGARGSGDGGAISDAPPSRLQAPRDSVDRDRVPVEGVAPGNPFLGVMLPYTPLHHLLMDAVAGQPLVMTSGNQSDEPIAYDDADALRRLGGIADLFLVHNRPIHVRCDDSVTRIIAGAESPVRRSRGYAPQPVTLPLPCRHETLAVGGQMKATFALGRGTRAILSQHMGDLDHLEAYRAFERDVGLFEDLFAIRPTVVAHDLHPDYASTHYARRLAAADPSIQCVGVQHHHAHMASCMAEHRLTAQVIGVSFDGTGYGTDGAVWGGEFLVGGYAGYRRAAHLRYVGMPGGERAVREPWRMAAAHLLDAGVSCPALERRVPPASWRTVGTMLQRRLNTPLTSSAGRLFDAVAALIGLRDAVTYEGQAAMELEWLATSVTDATVYPYAIRRADAQDSSPGPLIVDTRSIVQGVAGDVDRGVSAAKVARRFHSTMVAVIVDVCAAIRGTTGIATVVLSGGVFMNALLTCEASDRLQRGGFVVYRQEKVPPNDAGLSLGQLAVAAARQSMTA